MTNKIYPEYRPPVNSTRVRRLWAKGVGVNGALSGFTIREEPISGGGVSTILSKGSIISDNCVVEVDEMLLGVYGAFDSPTFVYGQYDEGSGDAFVEVSSSPKGHWVIIAMKWNGEWTVPDDVTAYSLRVGSSAHNANEDIHITSDEYDALVAEPYASRLNVFLKQSDKTVGMIYSPSDISMYPIGISGVNESKISPDKYEDNIMAGCAGSFSPGGGENGVSGNIESSMFTIEADGRWFEDTFRGQIAGAYKYQNCTVENIEKASPVSSAYFTLAILEESFEAIAAIDTMNDYSAEPILGVQVISIMFYAESEIDYIKMTVGMSTGDNKDVVINNPEVGKWVGMVSNISPENSRLINGFYVAVKGASGSSVRITLPKRAPVITFTADLSGRASLNSTSFRISPFGGVSYENSGNRYHLQSEGRDTFEILPFINHSPNTPSASDSYFKVNAVLCNAGGLINRVVTKWPEGRRDYCLTDSNNTGSSLLIGGKSSTGVKSTAISYSPMGNSMSTAGDSPAFQIEKASNSDFRGDVIISGGLVPGHTDISDSTMLLNIASMSIITKTPMVEPRSEHGSCSIDNVTSFVWGGNNERTIRSYNIVSDSWRVMSEIINIRGIRGGSYFKGAKLNNRALLSQNDIDNGLWNTGYESSGAIIMGVGNSAGNSGGKIDISSFSFVNLGVDNMVLGSNVTAQKYGVAVYQSEAPGDIRTGCMDIFSGTERKIEVPTTGRGSSGNSLHRDGRISYGPFSGLLGYDDTHNLYTYMTPCWLNGLALKWDDDNS